MSHPGEDVEQMELLNNPEGDAKWYSRFVELFGNVL